MLASNRGGYERLARALALPASALLLATTACPGGERDEPEPDASDGGDGLDAGSDTGDEPDAADSSLDAAPDGAASDGTVSDAEFSDGSDSGDGTPPQLLELTPSEDATDVEPDVQLVGLFDEPVVATDPIVLTGLVELSGTHEVEGDTLRFSPFRALTLDSVYHARIPASVSDLDGNELSAPIEWSFTTRAGSWRVPNAVGEISMYAAVDVNTAGEAVVAWQDTSGRIWVRRATDFADWSTADLVGTGPVESFFVAIDDFGATTVVWSVPNGLGFDMPVTFHSRRQPSAGGPWEPRYDHGEGNELAAAYNERLVVDAEGSAYFTWYDVDQGFFVERYSVAAGGWEGAINIEPHEAGGALLNRLVGRRDLVGAVLVVSSLAAGTAGDRLITRWSAEEEGWTAPMSFIQDTFFRGTSDLALTPDGDVIALWTPSGGDQPVAAIFDWTTGSGPSTTPIMESYEYTATLRFSVDAAGNAIAVAGRGSGPHPVHAQRYDATTASWGEVWTIATAGNRPFVGVDGSGNAFAWWTGDGLEALRYRAATNAWQEPSAIQDGSEWHIAGVAVAADGRALALSSDGTSLMLHRFE